MVSQMEPTLFNLVSVSTVLFDIISPDVEGKNVVLIIGDTGDGKTTMMSSLIFGPEHLKRTDNIRDILVK